MTPVPDWKIADVLDFESLLADDSRQSDDALRLRDHALFSSKIAPALPEEKRQDRRLVFLNWLDHRRAEKARVLPGEAYAAGWQTLVTVSAVVGLLMGGSLAAGLLHYSGDEPINALLFLAWTLGPQLLILIFAVLLWIERKTTRFLSDWRPMRALLAGLLALLSAGMRKLSGEQRDTLRAIFGRVGPKREVYGPLVTWSFLIVTQVFAVCFNLGIITTLLAELPARELRFGWQTTLNVTPDQTAGLVRDLSLPWRWAPNSHPSTEQVTATRYAPGQAHGALPGEAMRAWWPFLLYAVLFYGLAIRGAILVLAAVQLRRTLRGLKFDHADANALWRRLTGPLMVAKGGEARLPDVRRMDTRTREPRTPEATEHAETAGAQGTSSSADTPTSGAVPQAKPELGTCAAIVAQELALSPELAAAGLEHGFGWRMAGLRPAKIDNRKESAGLLQEIQTAASNLAGIAVIAPASRDPIMAIALFLRELVKASGGKPEILVLLTGAAEGDTFGTVDEARMEIWRRFRDIQQLPIGIERWP